MKVIINGFLIFLFLIFLVAVISCDSKSSTVNNNLIPNNLNINGHAYQLTHNDINILRIIIINSIVDHENGRDGSDVITFDFGNDLPFVISSDALQRDYDKNEIAADEKYKDKDLIIYGQVTSINRGIGEDYYLELKGGDNEFMPPRANMQITEKEYLAKMKKGEHVYLFCQGDGMLLGSAQLKNCIPTNKFIENKSNEYMEKINSNIRSGNSDSYQELLIVKAISSFFTNNNSTCYSDDMHSNYSKCLSELKALPIKKVSEKFEDLKKQYGIN